jgi:hypothetical protein
VPFAISDSFRFTRLQDYALMFSWNPYLDVFGRNLSVGLADTGTAESRARRALLRPDMLVIFTEELPKGGLDVLWRSLNETHPPKLRQMNTARHKPGHEAREPSTDELSALRSILAPDVALYQLAREKARLRAPTYRV